MKARSFAMGSPSWTVVQSRRASGTRSSRRCSARRCRPATNWMRLAATGSRAVTGCGGCSWSAHADELPERGDRKVLAGQIFRILAVARRACHTADPELECDRMANGRARL